MVLCRFKCRRKWRWCYYQSSRRRRYYRYKLNSRESAYDNGTSLDDNMPNMGVRITTSLKSIINSVK